MLLTTQCNKCAMLQRRKPIPVFTYKKGIIGLLPGAY